MLNFSKEAFWILGDEINFEFLKLDIRYTYLEYFYTFHFPTTSARCKKIENKTEVRTIDYVEGVNVKSRRMSLTSNNGEPDLAQSWK